MLVLSRKVGERIVISGGIVLEVVAITGSAIRLGIEAPKNVSILRSELITRDQKQASNDQSKSTGQES